MNLDFQQLEKGFKTDLIMVGLIGICIGSSITALIFFSKAIMIFFGG